MHENVRKQEIIFSSSFDGAKEQLVTKSKSGYEGIETKGSIKVPGPLDILEKNVNIWVAVDFQLSRVDKTRATVKKAGEC